MIPSFRLVTPLYGFPIWLVWVEGVDWPFQVKGPTPNVSSGRWAIS